MEIRKDIALYGKLAAVQLGLVTCRVEVTSDCFQKCRGCVSWRDHSSGKIKGEFALAEMLHLVKELRKYSMFEHITLTGGDPQKWPVLEQFLLWFQIARYAHVRNPRLQINTAMARDVKNPSLWRRTVDRVLVSMDACTPVLYQRMRGDDLNTPDTVAKRLLELNHPGLAFMITVYPENQEEFVDTVRWLNKLRTHKALPIRRIQVLAAIGSRKSDQNKKFWDRWRRDKERLEGKTSVPISFYGDSILETRKVCVASETKDVRCWASRISLHVKANGDVYPCCLIGGEAIDTYTPFCLGNVHRKLLTEIYADQVDVPKRYYQGSPCLETCQYKQLQINLAGEEAANTVLSMP